MLFLFLYFFDIRMPRCQDLHRREYHQLLLTNLQHNNNMACTIEAKDHISVAHEGGFSYGYVCGFNYEGIKRLPVSELRQIFGLVEGKVEGLKKTELIERLKELKVRFRSSDTVQKLREILVTEQQNQREKSLARGQKMTKKELAGQLRLYGIEFKASMTAAKLRELLIESVKEGKVC